MSRETKNQQTLERNLQSQYGTGNRQLIRLVEADRKRKRANWSRCNVAPHYHTFCIVPRRTMPDGSWRGVCGSLIGWGGPILRQQFWSFSDASPFPAWRAALLKCSQLCDWLCSVEILLWGLAGWCHQSPDESTAALLVFYASGQYGRAQGLVFLSSPGSASGSDTKAASFLVLLRIRLSASPIDCQCLRIQA
jgi:hypothetical protein